MRPFTNALPHHEAFRSTWLVARPASHWLERKLRTRRGGGKVVQIDPAAQSDLMAARQQIEILDAPGIDEFKKS